MECKYGCVDSAAALDEVFPPIRFETKQTFTSLKLRVVLSIQTVSVRFVLPDDKCLIEICVMSTAITAR